MMEDLMHLFQKWQANCRDKFFTAGGNQVKRGTDRATNL